MTDEAPPGASATLMTSERRSPSRRTRASKRIGVLYNIDYEDAPPELDPAWAARAEVAFVATSVAESLADGGYDAQLVPVDGDLSSLRDRLTELEPDCVFNLCESVCGDARLESTIPLLLDLLGVPYTGSPPEVLSLALRKDRVKQRLEAAGIPTPAGFVVTRAIDALQARQLCEAHGLCFPLIAKPVREDGSVGIWRTSVVHAPAELAAAVGAVVTRFRQPCLVEQFIDGREFNVALVGHPTPRVLPLSEIDFTQLPSDAPRIVSYDAKWTVGSVDDLGTVPVLHPSLPPAIAARVRRVAADAFRAVGVRDYGRVDVRLASTGIPYVVDVNPNCDLSPNAGLARVAASVGVTYASLVGLAVRYALRRRTKWLRLAPASTGRYTRRG